MAQSTTLALRDDARLEENLQWLMRAAALDEDYIATWPMKAWQQWSRLMDTPHGEPCPVTPEWMWPLTADRSIARTAPYPSLGLVFSSHDWFKENQLHPDLHLDVDAAPSHAWTHRAPPGVAAGHHLGTAPRRPARPHPRCSLGKRRQGLHRSHRCLRRHPRADHTTHHPPRERPPPHARSGRLLGVQRPHTQRNHHRMELGLLINPEEPRKAHNHGD